MWCLWIYWFCDCLTILFLKFSLENCGRWGNSQHIPLNASLTRRKNGATDSLGWLNVEIKQRIHSCCALSCSWSSFFLFEGNEKPSVGPCGRGRRHLNSAVVWDKALAAPSSPGQVLLTLSQLQSRGQVMDQSPVPQAWTPGLGTALEQPRLSGQRCCTTERKDKFLAFILQSKGLYQLIWVILCTPASQ